MKVIAVIPARYPSTRFPGKPLALISGKPMIQWVYENALQIPHINRVIVATDDERIIEAVKLFQGHAELTDPQLASGSDRVAAIAEKFQPEIIVNLQGDEPLLQGQDIGKAVDLVRLQAFEMATLMTPLKNPEHRFAPGIVKVLPELQPNGHLRALKFSRKDLGEKAFQHVGVYVYRLERLLEFTRLPPSQNEKEEKLEQLRAMDNGWAIGLAAMKNASVGVDYPEDIARVEKILENPL